MTACARCGASRYIKARDLCTPCWTTCDRDGTLVDWPPRKVRRSLPEVLDEYEPLAHAGRSHKEIAARLGYRATKYLMQRVVLARAER